ncbi:MAG: hypothetical protein V2A34_10790 [Lentisphaerota bacterium]
MKVEIKMAARSRWIPGLWPMMAMWMLAGGVQGVDIGSPQAEVIRELGQPTGVMKLGAREAFTYDGGVVELEKGKVVYIDPHFDEKTLRAQQAREFEAEQKPRVW